jgi:hypothetical protein
MAPTQQRAGHRRSNRQLWPAPISPPSRNGHAPSGNAPREQSPLVYVLGGAGSGAAHNPLVRDFPLPIKGDDESAAAYVRRAARRIDRVVSAGGTHLVIPRGLAAWLGDFPALVDYFAERHHLLEARAGTGLVFALRPPVSPAFTGTVEGWQVLPGDGIALVAPHTLEHPRLLLTPHAPVRGLRRGQLALSAHGLRTLLLRFVLSRPDRRRPHHRDLYLSLERPGFLMHQLPFVAATITPDGNVTIDFDIRLDRGRSLEHIEVVLAEEDNWRLHPAYPGGASFALPAIAPAGSRLTLHSLALDVTPKMRKGIPHGTVNAERPRPYRKPAGQPRDAVIFSSWVPDEGLVLGDYFIETLRRWHADSRIFVGVNHGSSPRWTERLARSGLDVTIALAPPTQTMPYDPTGFVAALDAFRRHDEPFDLVWFGHNKGGDHLDEPWYATSRWTIERVYWSRREEIAAQFADPIIGLYAPHYLMLLQDHLAQTDALQRLYAAPCQPLGVMAVSAHFVMRATSLRHFCAHVDPRFFAYGVAPFGGDRFFFEMAMPNLPIMQGYEPAIEPGFGGSSGSPSIDGVASILNDWRQNNAVAAIELAKWRRDPTHFRTRHHQHNRLD